MIGAAQSAAHITNKCVRVVQSRYCVIALDIQNSNKNEYYMCLYLHVTARVSAHVHVFRMCMHFRTRTDAKMAYDVLPVRCCGRKQKFAVR